MSRIAKEPVVVPQGVEVAIDGQKVTIKSKSGEMSLNVHPLVSVTLDNGALKVAVKDESKEANMQSGTTRALLNNYVVGLDKGFVKAMKLVGVGYRAAVYDVDVSLLTPPYLFILLRKLLGIPVGFIVIYLASKVTYRKLHVNHPRHLLR